MKYEGEINKVKAKISKKENDFANYKVGSAIAYQVETSRRK